MAILLARKRLLLFGRTSYHNAKDNGVQRKFGENKGKFPLIEIFSKKIGKTFGN